MWDLVNLGYLLLGALFIIYWLWHGGKMECDTIEAAQRIREDQGNHEVEVSCGGEADLHRHHRRCQKNPGHSHFIPIHDFKLESLPPGYRDPDIMDLVRAEADLTCRLSVRYTSESRPRFHPGLQPLSDYPFYQNRGGDWLRTGTGWIGGVFKYTNEDKGKCECKECIAPGTHTPKKVWGKVVVTTACHVVFDSDEARHTTCELWYDTSSSHVSLCPTLTGLKVEESNVVRDWCEMIYVTHDMGMIDKLYEMYHRRWLLWKKVVNKYRPNPNELTAPGVPCVTDPTPGPAVIISHPHGCSKQVTVGMWTHREVCTERVKYKDEDDGWEADMVGTRYRYNTPTCHGSSGAPMFRLPEKGKSWWWFCHPHSEGGQGNNNKSAVGVEFVSSST